MFLFFFLTLISLIGCASVELTCNKNWCPPSWLGDRNCDPECMTPYCGYDIDPILNSDDPQYSDCYCDCVYNDGCPEHWLGDGNCDPLCNTWRCGYDWGDCRYCAGDCKFYSGHQYMLEIGSCEIACNRKDCYYDIGICEECSAGCGAELLGDGNCDSECNNPDCNFDFGDCADPQCAPGCYTWMIRDRVCEESCDVEECGFDFDDCYCSPGCYRSMLGNGVCEPLCDNRICDLDGRDCGYCADGCYENMLGDLICNPECNNHDCNYDFNDCGCSFGCTFADYGNCKAECLVANCYYDQISVDSSKRCKDEGLVKFALYQSLFLWRDFSKAPDLDSCLSASSDTCDTSLATDPETCHPECDIDTCGYSYGNCSPENTMTCTSDCASCYDTEESACLRCEDHAVQYYGYCYSSCPSGMEARTVLDSNPICFPTIDISSIKYPHIYYVTSIKTDNPVGGHGTLEYPFETLAVALASIKKKYCLIYLLNDGEYEISVIDSYYVFNDIKYIDLPLYQNGSNYIVYVKITSYDGTMISFKRNPDFYLLKQWITAGLTLEMENIIIDGSETRSDCYNRTYCSYCPYVEEQLDGSYKDDRGNKITEFLDQSECDKWASTNLFEVKGGALNLTNVSFENWRMQFQSIIYVKNGLVYLNNVNFENIIPSREEIGAA